jgi:dienelactone hydrolase/prenyltransferase beta subunit
MLGLTACCVLLLSDARAQTPAERAQTAGYLAAFQNPDGGFATAAGQKSSLGATSSAIRSLKNVAGSVKDVPGCISYVKSCVTAEGGIAPAPGGQPTVNTTAVGLMALAELKIADENTVGSAVAYLARNAKTFEEIRIAVAGLEAVGARSNEFAAWTAKVKEDRNADGTWGQGPNQARSTGGAAVALLRMGVDLDKKDAVIAALRAAQRGDGAWGKDDGPSDLEATYRIMRAFFMLKESPNLEALKSFIARCRQSNGGYTVAPGRTPDGGGTYYATTILRWVRLLDGEPAVVETAGFVPLFNGKNLDGWEGDTSLWSARDGMLVGKTDGLKHNDFMATTRSYGDFILKLSFRLIGGAGNSGVQFRSVRVPGHEMSGYQADIGEGYWASLYDESRRNKVMAKASDRALAAVHKDRWNHYVVRAMGGHITLSLNGVTSVDYKEGDAGIAQDGKLAVQIHAGGPMEIQFKDVYIQPLPIPVSDNTTAQGFHLRTLKAPDGERKYTVFVPYGYDGKKLFPAVLFLHGAGERGDDGIRGAQVGLGAIVAGMPNDFPALAVFPQAKRTWSADSDDARAALAALDDVMASFRVDPSRVALTGLSMGGAGAWSVAAAQPNRFSALVPICGRGRTETATLLKDLPVWAVVGDADRDETVLNTRAMVVALREAGQGAKLTEYRGVGHNSWDRAYSDPALIAWMLNQKRKTIP